MRPVVRGPVPTNEDGTDVVFGEYGEAKRFLINRLGIYCSYCERCIPANLAVEHIRPKDRVPELELVWDNFLLACSSCNSTKGDDDLVLADYFWPHLDNTFHYLSYDDSGLVKVQTGLTAAETIKAENTIALTGLATPKPKPDTTKYKKASDLRVELRLIAWRKAQSHLVIFENARAEDREELSSLLVDIVQGFGFWSIWMTVFENHPIVTQALVNGFVGTNKAYFPEPV